VLALLVFFGFGAALVGIASAAAFATSPKRAAILSLCGVLGIVAFVAAGFISADTSPCNDCNAYQGRYVSPLFFFFGALNVAGWYGGVALGASLRGSRIVSDEDRLYRLASLSVAVVAFSVLLLIGF
jgi:hypothetical protein